MPTERTTQVAANMLRTAYTSVRQQSTRWKEVAASSAAAAACSVHRAYSDNVYDGCTWSTFSFECYSIIKCVLIKMYYKWTRCATDGLTMVRLGFLRFVCWHDCLIRSSLNAKLVEMFANENGERRKKWIKSSTECLWAQEAILNYYYYRLIYISSSELKNLRAAPWHVHNIWICRKFILSPTD